MHIKLLVIYGPTATGKTSLAIDLAKKLNGEIISVDSRQVYKGLDIGTGKLSIERLSDSTIERFNGFWIVDGVKIHGFDLVDPGDQFTVADFLKYTNSSMIQIIELKKLPIIVGGTGFYIKVLIDGIDSIGIPPDPKLRRRLEKLTVTDLYQKLLDVNSQRAGSMNQSDRANPRRLIRAIEIAMYRPFTSEESEPTSEVWGVAIVGLTAPNLYLYQRADQWLEQRLQKGMIDEVKNLLTAKIDPKWLESLGLEYRWLTRYLASQISKDQAIEKLKGDTHNFIRRQKTWFKKFPNIKLFDISKPNWYQKIEKTVKDWYNEAQ